MLHRATKSYFLKQNCKDDSRGYYLRFYSVKCVRIVDCTTQGIAAKLYFDKWRSWHFILWALVEYVMYILRNVSLNCTLNYVRMHDSVHICVCARMHVSPWQLSDWRTLVNITASGIYHGAVKLIRQTDWELGHWSWHWIIRWAKYSDF